MNTVWLETLRGNAQGERRLNPWGAVSAGQRYAVAISKILSASIVHDADTWRRHVGAAVDAIIVGYSTIYQEYKADGEFIRRHPDARVYHVATEYGNAAPAALFYAKRPFVHIANYERIPEEQHGGAWQYRTGFVFANLNAMLYRDSYRPSEHPRHGCIYWGRYRPDRAVYLRDVAAAGVTVSTSRKNVDDWHAAGVRPKRWVQPCTWMPGHETIRAYQYCVYVEDQYTHTNYNCPANRWYEALDADVQTLVHASCLPTFRRAGYDIPAAVVWRSADELMEMIATTTIRHEQAATRNTWRELAREERQTAAADIKAAICNA